MNIKYKLVSTYLLLIIFSVCFLGFWIGKKSEAAVFNEVTEKSQRIAELINTTISVKNDLLAEKSNSDLNLTETLLNNMGEIHIDYTESIKVGEFDLPVLYAGEEKLTLNTKFVDKIKEATGTIPTIFLLNDRKLIRISTSLYKGDERAVGTYIFNYTNIYKKIINNEEYTGRVIFDGKTYISSFKPLLDKNNNVIGAIALGAPVLNNYLEKTIQDMKIGKTGYVYVLNSSGIKIIDPMDSDEDIYNCDSITKIISTKNGTMEYTHKEIRKLAYYTYFEPWDWYVVVTANYDDLKSSSKSILYTTFLSGILCIFLGGIIAYLMSKTVVKPINDLKTCMELAGKGDLTVRSAVNSKDEIGILSNSFNNMIAENQRLLDEAMQYDKLKTEFIANMSHELRTPLNIIFSSAQLMPVYLNKEENSSNTKKIIRYTDIIKQNCYRLLRLVNNLIDISKIDSGFMELDLKNKNIVEVAENIALSTAEYIQSISRTIIFDTEVEEKIMAFDEEKLERILLNLISNATKFTEPGDEIEVKLQDKDDLIIISVKDSGIGIPEDKLSQIFERFKQVDSLLDRKHEGSGIGLAIVKSLVGMHGGNIEVKSKYEEGTEFIITLPVTRVSEEDNEDIKKNLPHNTNIEKISIEFSDIYE
jgi:signal transduction histidine kinase